MWNEHKHIRQLSTQIHDAAAKFLLRQLALTELATGEFYFVELFVDTVA